MKRKRSDIQQWLVCTGKERKETGIPLSCGRPVRGKIRLQSLFFSLLPYQEATFLFFDWNFQLDWDPKLGKGETLLLLRFRKWNPSYVIAFSVSPLFSIIPYDILRHLVRRLTFEYKRKLKILLLLLLLLLFFTIKLRLLIW